MEKSAFAKLENFFSKYKKILYKKGETILRAQDEPRGVLYLKKGYTKLYSVSKNAQELTLIIFKPEDFFPIMWAINATPHTYYMDAMTSVELYQAPREEFLKFIKNDNELLFEINSRVLTRFGGLLKRMEHAMFGNAYSKVASIIVIFVERHGLQDKKGILVHLPVTHQDIAKLLGIARETVSIEMKKMQKKGLIEYRSRHLIVKNLPLLIEESSIDSV
ncbi:Crp/Fnr family transcriptional regulator [Candidatus Daviesbacteria bacterium]|nr:Crp/Fnr family transcriptional regulator [Candidatus Daviesbacteria bacterium]